MARNIAQVFADNPITSNASTDLMYFGQSPYGLTNDAAMTYGNFYSQQWGNLAISSNSLISTNSNGNISIDPNGSGLVLFNTTASFSLPLNTPLYQFTAASPASTIFNDLVIGSFGPSVTSGIKGTRSRGGTVGSYTAVQDDDTTFNIGSFGADGTQLRQNTGINFAVDGAVSAGIVPGKIRFYTSNTAGVSTLVATMSNAQVLTLANALPASSGGTGVANSGTITVGGNTSLIGDFTFAGTLTAATTVTFPTSGTLATTAQMMPFSNVSGTSQAAAVNNGYIIGNAGQTTVTLPATAAIGDRVAVCGNGAAGWILTANGGQTIKLGSSTTSSGGTLTSANQYDEIEVVCLVANTTWGTRFAFSAGLTVA